MAHITAADSVDQPAGDAFTGTGPDTLIVDADAFLISESGGNGARLSGAWTATINGVVAGFGSVRDGLSVSALSISDVSNVKVGKTGDNAKGRRPKTTPFSTSALEPASASIVAAAKNQNDQNDYQQCGGVHLPAPFSFTSGTCTVPPCRFQV